MTEYGVSTAFVDDVARFDGTAAQIARLRARSGTRADPPTSGASPREHPPGAPDAGRRWDRFLLWLAGIDYELASRSFVDRARYATLGLAILVTALAAGISFFLVVSSAGVAPTPSVVLSVPWALLITTLERTLAASASRRFDGVRGAIGVTVIRLAISVLVAVVIAQPLMLKLFQPEIENQIQTTRVEQSQAFTARQYNGQVFADARRQLDLARTRLTDAQERAACEMHGTCGTGVPGMGAEALQRRADADRAKTEYDAANSHYQSVLMQIERSTAEVADRPVGLLEQFVAFSDVSSRDPSVLVASVVVVALFVAIEMLPVILVGIGRRRGTSLYEKLLAIHERYVRDQFELEAAGVAGQRLADDSDPEVDTVLRRFEQQRAEIGQLTQDTLSSVVQLAEERRARRQAV